MRGRYEILFFEASSEFLFPSHLRRSCLGDLVAEHLDQLHYLNDILSLGIDPLNAVLTDHLQNRLLLPLYGYSLCSEQSTV